MTIHGEMRPGARPKSERGFTLIELLMVVMILGVLAAIVIVQLQNALDRGKQRGSMADMRTVAMALETYRTDVDHYPTNGLTIDQLASVLIPYQTSVLHTQDHWLHDYGYSYDGLEAYSVESYGKDGIDGSEISHATRDQFDLDLVISNGLFTASPES